MTSCGGDLCTELRYGEEIFCGTNFIDNNHKNIRVKMIISVKMIIACQNSKNCFTFRLVPESFRSGSVVFSHDTEISDVTIVKETHNFMMAIKLCKTTPNTNP